MSHHLSTYPRPVISPFHSFQILSHIFYRSFPICNKLLEWKPLFLTLCPELSFTFTTTAHTHCFSISLFSWTFQTHFSPWSFTGEYQRCYKMFLLNQTKCRLYVLVIKWFVVSWRDKFCIDTGVLLVLIQLMVHVQWPLSRERVGRMLRAC